ncbi:MAG: nitroreductase family deazaflavin-dependent oxidoreductase [Chloroflexi bacterium]|nr:nitroreductase family deazaflavin-dependent oxidoreductase [Chloroflexota bacterium]
MIAADDRVRRALQRGHRIDITTTGRKSGRPRRIELVFHNIDGRIYISGRPGWPRGWIANLRANPHMTFHLKQGFVADLPATARVITDRAERERVLGPISVGWGYDTALMVVSSPLIEVTFPDA